MKIRIPFCPPFIRTVEGQGRLLGLLVKLPFVTSASCRVFHRRDIRRCFRHDVEQWDVIPKE